MKNGETIRKHILLRATIVAGTVIFIGYIFYQPLIFSSDMKPFQFTVSGITAGLAYAYWKNSTLRNMLAALFIWYLVVTGLLVDFNWWLPILNLIYICGITCAIIIYNHIVAKRFVKGIILRVIFAGAIISVTNGIIIVVLGLVSLEAFTSGFLVLTDAMKFNLEIGVIIGLAVGAGIEIAEYLSVKLIEYERAHK